MKKIAIIITILAAAGKLMAQDIQITKFERNYTSLIASANAIYDNAGDACAVLRCYVRGTDYVIEPNLGVLKRETLPGEIRLYVPKGTKKLTIRCKDLMPLTGYEIPVRIESKVTYDVEISLTDVALNRNKANKGHNVYVGAGYNIASISGPSVALGFDIKNHNIELGAVFGMNKTDDLYFYDSNSNVTAAYSYQAIRIQLSYGYDLKLTDFFSVMPQIGVAYNFYNGKEVVSATDNSDYKSINSVSASASLRLIASFNDRFKLHITPEYDFAVSKDNKYKMLSNYDSNFKSWTEGFNLNIGLLFFF